MIRTLKQSDLLNFVDFCSTRDKFSDFYITVDNKRLFLNNPKNAMKVFYNCLKRNDKCFIKEDKMGISGIALVTGYSDKFSRKYLKIFSEDVQIIDDLLKMITWNLDIDLNIKIKKDNPVGKVAQRWGFQFQRSQDREILFFRKFNKALGQNRKFAYVKEGDDDES